MSELPRLYGVAAGDGPLIGTDQDEPVTPGEPACRRVVGRQHVIPAHERDDRAARVPGWRADFGGGHDRDTRVEQQLQLIARNARRLNDRAAHLLELVRATAARDSQIATLWHDINNDRHARARTSAQQLAAKTTLRTSVPDAAHTLWALTVPELYVLHVTESGRSPQAYQHWLADVLIAVLIAH